MKFCNLFSGMWCCGELCGGSESYNVNYVCVLENEKLVVIVKILHKQFSERHFNSIFMLKDIVGIF